MAQRLKKITWYKTDDFLESTRIQMSRQGHGDQRRPGARQRACTLHSIPCNNMLYYLQDVPTNGTNKTVPISLTYTCK